MRQVRTIHKEMDIPRTSSLGFRVFSDGQRAELHSATNFRRGT